MELDAAGLADERALLLRWALKRHACSQGGGCVDEHGVPVRAFSSLDVSGLHAESVVAAIEEGGTLSLAALKAASAAAAATSCSASIGHTTTLSQRTSVTSAAAGSRSSTPPCDTCASDIPTTSQVSLAAPPIPLSRDVAYAPVLLRRHVVGDVRPFAPWSSPLPLLKDDLLPNVSERASHVALCAYDYALISCGMSSRAVRGIEKAMGITPAVRRGTRECLVMHSPELLASLEKGQPGPREPPRGAAWELLRTDVASRIGSLMGSFRNPRRALEAFAGEGPLLRDWRRRTAMLLCDCALYTEGCDASAVAEVFQTLMQLSGSVNKHDARWDSVEASLRGLFAGRSGACPMPLEVAAELYAALCMLGVAVDDDTEPLDAGELFDTLSELRGMWGIDDALHAAVRAAIYVELLALQGCEEGTTCAAIAKTLAALRAPPQPTAQVWALSVSSAVGHIHKAFLVRCRTLPRAVLRDAAVACSRALSLCGQQDVMERQAVAVLSQICGNQTFDLGLRDAKSPKGGWAVHLMCGHALFHSVSGHWKSLVSLARRQMQAPVTTGTLKGGTVVLDAVAEPHPAALPNALLRVIEEDTRKYDNLLKGAGCPELAGLLTAAYLGRVVDVLLHNLGDANLDFSQRESVQFLRGAWRYVARDLHNRCAPVQRVIERYSTRLRPAGERAVLQRHESMSSYVRAAQGSLTWHVEEGARQVIPEVIDVFNCFNDTLSDVDCFFYKGASTDLHRMAQVVSGNVQVIVASFTDAFLLTRGGDVTTAEFGMTLPAMVLALNSLSLARQEYESSIQAMQSAWKDIAPFLGEREVTLSTTATRTFLSEREAAVTRHIAEKVTLRSGWQTELYAVDLKHYKKHKSEKGYLSKHGPASHMVHSSAVTVASMLDDIDEAMTTALPIITPEAMRLRIVKLSLDTLVSMLEWALLGESTTEKHKRYFHEGHAPGLLRDIDMIEHFYAADGSGLKPGDIDKRLGWLKSVIKHVMSRPSEDLLRDSPYETLPEDSRTKPLTRSVVRAVTDHRRDKAAKKFVAKSQKDLKRNLKTE